MAIEAPDTADFGTVRRPRDSRHRTALGRCPDITPSVFAAFQDLARVKMSVLTRLMAGSLGVFLAVLLLAGFARDLMIVEIGSLGLVYLLILGALRDVLDPRRALRAHRGA